MKVFKIIFVLFFVISIISSCGIKDVSHEEDSITVDGEKLVTTEYAIEGMVCAMGCAATIEKDVEGINGVVVSKVSYETGKAYFEFDDNVVSEKEIIAKIESIAQGQYKVGEWTDENSSGDLEKDEESENSEETITEVSLPSFEIPNLFTLLMDQI